MAVSSDADRRIARRFKVNAAVKLLPEESRRWVTGRIVDVSDSGAAAELDAPIPAGAIVHLEIRSLHLYGTAYIVRCKRRWWKYKAALEFKGALLGAVAALLED
ncbi:MAG: PilZ domain-containing protein [Bryobacteraceae bacterium]